MRCRCWLGCLLAIVASLLGVGSSVLAAQQQSNSQALQLLQRALAALEGRTAISDVLLTGVARRIAGSEDETGSATLEATAIGQSSMSLGLSSGPLKITRNQSGTARAGQWFGADGAAHSIAEHNLVTPASWFYPEFALRATALSGAYVVTYVGEETTNGKMVYHIQVYKQSSEPPLVAYLESRLSQMDVFLDANTLLPVALGFNEHPDNNAEVDIPTKVEFSDYRSADNGAAVPYHVQKYVNNNLVLDLQLETVKFNTGVAVGSSNTQ
jgi:hypothetical protein